MNSRTKLTLSVTAMVSITLLAVVSIMAVFAARQQSFSTSISVVYHSTSVEGIATAQWKLGHYYDYGFTSGWTFWGDWNNMDSNGAEDGGQTELDLSADGSLSLSPDQSIELSDEYPAVVLKYSFTNTASHPFTLNFNYQATNTTKNINSFYAASSQEIDDGNLGDISNKFTNMLETTVLGGDSENIYILLKIDDWGSDSLFDGTFNIKLDGITSGLNEDYVYLYDGTKAVLSDVVNQEIEEFNSADLIYNDISVTEIGKYAFYNNTNLKTVTLDGIDKIDDGAFKGCTELTTLTIGEEVKSFGESIFESTSKLQTLKYNAVNATFADGSYGGNGIFNSSGWGGDGISVEFGDKVETIPARLFSIGGGSLTQYPKVVNIVWGNNVQAIGDEAFGGSGVSCKSITIPQSIKSIGQRAFNTQLEDIKVESGNQKYTSRNANGDECNAIIEIETKTLIAGCKNTIIPADESVEIIGDMAFLSCPDLINVTIPGNITEIGSYAFDGCEELQTVIIPGNVKQIGDGAFSVCFKLAEILNKSSLQDDDILSEWDRNSYGIRIIHQETEKGKFNTVDGVIYYSYDNNVIAIGLEDENMQGELTLQENTTAIKGYAFHNCANITTVIIPESVTNIGGSAFYVCSGLTSVTIDSQEVCNNLLDWSTELEGWLQVGGTIKAKYEIVNLLDRYSNFSKSDTQIDGYWVYTNTGEY